jgi:hypothetical protein
MGWYGTLLLAKPVYGNLPAYPGVRQAFGSWFGTSASDERGLFDLGGGWQRISVQPAYREYWRLRDRLAVGVAELAAATGAPAVAAWVSESVCVHLEARSPAGLALSLHLPNTDEECGHEHPAGQLGQVASHHAVEALEAWAREAGRTPSRRVITAVVDGEWDESPFPEYAVLVLFAALGFPSERQIMPVVDWHDPAFGDHDLEDATRMADIKAANRASVERRGGSGWELTPQEHDYLRFNDQVWASVYGGGPTRDELAAEYRQLKARWPDAAD